MTAHPIDVAIVDGVDVVKSSVRSYEKQRMRLRMADATEVRNTKLSGHYGGIYVSSLSALFDLDTTDTTTADDGENCIIDFDGNRFKVVSITPDTGIPYIIDGGGSTIGLGFQALIPLPFDFDITGWALDSADVVGSAVVHVLNVPFNTVQNISQAISGATPPTISSARGASSTDVADWDTVLTAGDRLGFYVASLSNFTRLTITVLGTRP